MGSSFGQKGLLPPNIKQSNGKPGLSGNLGLPVDSPQAATFPFVVWDLEFDLSPLKIQTGHHLWRCGFVFLESLRKRAFYEFSKNKTQLQGAGFVS